METKGKVVIASKKEHSQDIEKLRWISYHNSLSFEVVDDVVFRSNCKWSETDNSGIILLVLDHENNPLSTLRGNIYNSQNELENYDINFKGNSKDFFHFPVLNMSFAATSPTAFNLGLNSVLRYYFYILHRHCVKYILGTGTFNSSIYKTLDRLNYEFRFVTDLRTDLLVVDKKFIAALNHKKLQHAINDIGQKYKNVIKQYPLIIS